MAEDAEGAEAERSYFEHENKMKEYIEIGEIKFQSN